MIGNGKNSAQKTSFTVRNAAVIVFLLACFVFYATFMPDETRSDRPTGPNRNGFDLLDMESKATTPPLESLKSVDKHQLADIIKPLEYPLKVYIRALQRSVRVLTVPRGKVLNQAIIDCEVYRQPPLLDHQHSLELRFPFVLSQMRLIAETYHKPQYDLLYQNTTTEPLFYFLQSYQYYIVYCSFNRRNKESWDVGDRYVSKLATYTIHTKEFQRNTGTDFMVPASHPKSGPIGVKYADKSTYQRQAFLRTDMDWNGFAPKDIIVPYYVPSTSIQKKMKAGPAPPVAIGVALPPNHLRPVVDPTSRASWFLFFAGGRNPPGGLREQMEEAFDHLAQVDHLRDILFTTNALTADQFDYGLQHSVFCPTVRGDTASSSRLFAVIEAGCIPVIVADWLPLPFSNIIDYTKFTVRFPESIVHNVRQLIAHLRAFTPEQIRSMQTAVRTARTMLIYPQMSAVSEFYLLNPVTLTLVDMFMRRKEYCDELEHLDASKPSLLRGPAGGTGEMSNMCMKLYARLREAVFSVK